MWLPAGLSPSQLSAEIAVPLELGGHSLLLILVEGQPVAISRGCPHAAADLGAGAIHRGRITCPKHGYKFALDNGRCLYPADETYRLRRYPVEHRADRIWVQLPDGF